ncbi:MAG: hypothetical protein AAGG07_10210 [Planctomycetota bacterium]
MNTGPNRGTWSEGRDQRRRRATAPKHVPGTGGVEIVIKAAQSAGVGERELEAVRSADAALREFVRKHAGDRRSFEAMLAAGGRDEALEHEERRSHFRAGAAIWGVRARTQLLMLALKPSDTADGMLDVVQLGGLIGFERLRPDVPWIIRRLRVHDDDGKPMQGFDRAALDPCAANQGIPLYTPMCSEPLPEIRQFEGGNGWLFDEIAPGPVGRSGSLSCITGEAYRAALPFRRAEGNETARYALTVRTPVEAVVFDLLLHESLSHFSEPELQTFALIEDRPSSSRSAAPMYEPRPANALGAPPVMQTRRLAGYAEHVRAALDTAGFGPIEHFRGYRAEAEYPAAPSELKLVCSID